MAETIVSLSSINNSFVSILRDINDEIKILKSNKDTNSQLHITFLRSLHKNIKTLKLDVNCLSKQTKKRTYKGGFTKECQISDDLADFLNLERGCVKSRAECTHLLHTYIKEHSLQNEKVKREIIPDKALAKLLNFERTRDGPLYYSTIQKLIQIHFNRINSSINK